MKGTSGTATGTPSVAAAPPAAQPAVIPSADSLIGDLLSIDLAGGFSAPVAPIAPGPIPGLDVLGGGLDALLGGDVSAPPAVAATDVPVTTATAVSASGGAAGLLGDIFGVAPASAFHTLPKQMWLEATRGKG